jgi:uncharacterized protein (DUF427 family)
VWDYPRPPRVEEAGDRIRVVQGGALVADSRSALRVLETSHPPSFYVPPADVDLSLLERTTTRTWCEWKGPATYWTVRVGTTISADAAWSYEDPVPAFEAIRSHLAFHPALVDECWVGDERAQAQPGGFYGGWITSRVVGPFKGAPGTSGW